MYRDDHFKYVLRITDWGISNRIIYKEELKRVWKEINNSEISFSEWDVWRIEYERYELLERNELYAYADRKQEPRCIAKSTGYPDGKVEVPWYSDIIIMSKTAIQSPFGNEWRTPDNKDKSESALLSEKGFGALFIIFNRLQKWEQQQNVALLKQIRNERRFMHYSRDFDKFGQRKKLCAKDAMARWTERRWKSFRSWNSDEN